MYRDRLYFPAYGMTLMGVLREIEPVQTLAVTTEALAAALAQGFSTPRPCVEEYRRGDPPLKSPVQVAARCRSWIAFARESLRYAVVEGPREWSVSVGQGPTPEDVETLTLPLAASTVVSNVRREGSRALARRLASRARRHSLASVRMIAFYAVCFVFGVGHVMGLRPHSHLLLSLVSVLALTAIIVAVSVVLDVLGDIQQDAERSRSGSTLASAGHRHKGH